AIESSVGGRQWRALGVNRAGIRSASDGGVEPVDCCHIVGAQGEVEDVDVLGARAGLTLAVDHLGNGLSDKPHDPDAYAWPAVAADVVAGIDAAGVERAAVWGYSRGAALAGAIAAGFPDRVAALILSGGGDLSHVTPKA